MSKLNKKIEAETHANLAGNIHDIMQRNAAQIAEYTLYKQIIAIGLQVEN